jgi:alpha-beta hydrolase superfamily lysophospholipase
VERRRRLLDERVIVRVTGRIVELGRPDGVTLRYRQWPTPPQPIATAICFNGIMSHSAWLSPLADALMGAGVRVIGADRRGSGPNHAGRGDAESGKTLVDDALAVIQTERGPAPLVLVGWCWGAALAIQAALAVDPPPAALVLVTPGLCPTAQVKARAQALLEAVGEVPEDSACVPSPIAEEMFTQGPALDGFIRKDADRVRMLTPRFSATSAKLSAFALARLPKVEVPVLVVLAEDDEATDNEATRTAFARLPPERREIVTLPGGHGVIFDAPDELATAIAGFVHARTGAAR